MALSRKNRLSKLVLIVSGTFFLGLGITGIFLPLLPATPFILLAALCYARNSKKLYNWLVNNGWFGNYIKNYREGKGIFRIALWFIFGIFYVYFFNKPMSLLSECRLSCFEFLWM